MKFESLGGAKNPYEALQPSDRKMEYKEGHLNFVELKKQFLQQAVFIFKEQSSFMDLLRADPEFQAAVYSQKFDVEDKFTTLAKTVGEELDDRFQLEDERQQAALLAVLARLEMMRQQDERAAASGDAQAA